MSVIGEILSNEVLADNYYRVCFHAPEICRIAQPGQFVHVKINALRERLLRRPFSICNVEPETGSLSIVYKRVGAGTDVLASLPPGAHCDLLGPLGKPFSLPSPEETPVLLAGGYGAAATYLLARRSPKAGLLLLGARSKEDLLLIRDYEALGFDVKLATEDGSRGQRGYVTTLLPDLLQDKSKNFRFYACGPHPMLMALGKILLEAQYPDSELSLDHRMCCGVGACFACVVKVKAETPEGWRYARTCTEGPVFRASEVYYE